MNINNILVSDNNYFDEKNYRYFIGYWDENKIKPLTLILLETNAYVKSYDVETKWMYFSIEDEEFLQKYNDIWNDISNNRKEEFDSVYNKRYLKSQDPK